MGTRYALVAGDPVTHKSEVLDLLQRNLIPSREVALARYRKYYESNPDGPPLLVLAQEESDSYVGTCAIFPTRVWVSEEAVRGGICGDFAVDAAHRGFGPAVALQRDLFDRLEEQGMSYVYGVPNPSSEAITQLVGYRDLGRLTRFVKVLHLDIVLERYVRREALVRLGAGISSLTADPLLSLFSKERLTRRSSGFSVEKFEAFNERFAAVWEAARSQARVTAYRGTTFLNWKFDKAGPGTTMDGYSIFALVSGDGVVAYIVHTTRQKVCEIIDIAFLPSQEVLDALLSRFLRDAHRRRVSAVDLRYFGPRSLLTQRLRAFGFVTREHASGLTVFVKKGTPLSEEFLVSGNWCLFPAAQDI